MCLERDNWGIQVAVAKNKLSYLRTYVINKEFTLEDGKNAAKELLNSKDRLMQ